MYKKIFLTMLVICSGGAMIAVDYNTQNSRNPDANTSYGRLLSDAYRVILNHERQKGTFSNIDFFKDQANNVVTMYNPRPLTTGEGQVQNIKKRQELRMQRFELERFMNGYAGRIATTDVAMMHASYDCRVKNIEMNPKMDNQCQQMFMHHKQQAEAKVNDYLGSVAVQPATTADPIPTTTPEPVIQEPQTDEHRPLMQQPTPIPVPIPVPQSKDFPSEEGLLEMPQVPKKPMAEMNPVTNDIEIKDEASNTMALPQPQEITQTHDYMGNKKFNPLKSIHPSLQNNSAPKETFGIKPTSKIKVSDSHNDAQQFDPIATASIRQSDTQNQTMTMTIPFSYGLAISTDGKRNLGKINQLLKQGKHTNITIIGHADKGNNDAIDALMSQKRANHIKGMLQHANPNLTITTSAAGATEPLQGITISDDRNRRASIIFN